MQLPRELIGVEDDGEGAIVVDLDQHHGPKLAGFHTPNPGLSQSPGEIVHQWRGGIWRGGMDKAGTPSLSAVGVQGELGDKESFAVHIEDREVGLAGGVANFSYAAAIGLFNSVLGLILLLAANQISKRFSQTSLF